MVVVLYKLFLFVKFDIKVKLKKNSMFLVINIFNVKLIESKIYFFI